MAKCELRVAIKGRYLINSAAPYSSLGTSPTGQKYFQEMLQGQSLSCCISADLHQPFTQCLFQLARELSLPAPLTDSSQIPQSCLLTHGRLCSVIVYGTNSGKRQMGFDNMAKISLFTKNMTKHKPLALSFPFGNSHRANILRAWKGGKFILTLEKLFFKKITSLDARIQCWTPKSCIRV